jgi:hypothetical protein
MTLPVGTIVILMIRVERRLFPAEGEVTWSKEHLSPEGSSQICGWMGISLSSIGEGFSKCIGRYFSLTDESMTPKSKFPKERALGLELELKKRAVLPSAALHIRSGNYKGACYFIETNCLVGRHPENHIVLPDKTVSRMHAIISPKGQGFLIRDLSSCNGTFVNGQKIQQIVLKNDDEIQVGSTRMMFVEALPF